MNLSDEIIRVYQLCQPFQKNGGSINLRPLAPNQLRIQICDKISFIPLGEQISENSFFLVSCFASDERQLEDGCFKIQSIFSHPSVDLFLMVEYLLPEGEENFPSLSDYFPAVSPFEREIKRGFGLSAEGGMEGGPLLPLDTGRYPLRCDYSFPADPLPPVHFQGTPVPEGESYLPVGPIHAGVIEPGRFLFRTSGETIEGLDLRLGYAHKGVEFLFQQRFKLSEGWRLAERVAGDSSYAHSLAYCQAVEALAGIRVLDEIQLMRGLCLELERMTNHIADVAALVHDLALELPAAELSVLREKMARLNQQLCGHRFLRGVNCPGGLVLPQPPDLSLIKDTIQSVSSVFGDLAYMLIYLDGFRERTIGVGILGKKQAMALGVVGLVARASGIPLDFRLLHPSGIYTDEGVQQILKTPEERLPLPMRTPSFTGDVFSRFLVRAREVFLSVRLIEYFIEELRQFGNPIEQSSFFTPLDYSAIPAFESRFSWVEGWRGNIGYWVTSDKFNRIFRCKPCDPSMFNWEGLKAVVEPHRIEETLYTTSLMDFPVINKSFNLSYSGYDL